MAQPVTLVLALIAAVLLPAQAIAQSCDAYFSFDGDLNDSSGSGANGRMIGKDGAIPTPEFAEGKIAQALKLDGKSAMRAFVDLNYEVCSQVTMTAWVLFEPGVSKRTRTQHVISTGAGSGPGFRVSGSNLVLNGTTNGLMQSNAIRENAGWTFIAGVYDYENDTYALHWRGRSKEIPLSANRKFPEDAIWVGAYNDGLSNPASGVLVDELRFYGRILTEDELRGMQAGRVPDFSAPGGSTPQVATLSCSTADDCGAGTYCAFDNTCHPESHLPKRQFELAVAPAPTPTVLPLPGSSQGGRLSDEAYDALQDKVNENSPPIIGYATEEEALAAADRREREAYQSELSRQQNELERQRREEAEAEAAATAANNTSGSDGTSDGPEGSGVVIGGIELSIDYVESGISGITGEIVDRVDLEVFPMNFVSILENNDKPCEITIANGSFIEHIDRCGVGFSFNSSRKLRRDGKWGVTALRVGDKVDDGIGKDTERVKGLWLEFAKFDDSGGLSGIRETDSYRLTNWNGWKQLISCPDGHVATGLVAHMYPGRAPSAGTDYLAGLKLICREVVSGSN